LHKLANCLSYPKESRPVRKLLKLKFMATLNEISLILGLVASGLFYFQYKKYEAEAEKEEMINSFLSE